MKIEAHVEQASVSVVNEVKTPEVTVTNDVRVPRLIGRKGKTKVNRKRGEMESTETEERYEYEG